MISDGPAFCSLFNARTIALVRACAVCGFFFKKASGAYSVAAGSEPPNKSWVSFIVRVATMTLISFFCSSIVITGSRFEIASICPERIADSAPAAVPPPKKNKSLGFRPPLASTKFATMLVGGPGAGAPGGGPGGAAGGGGGGGGGGD